MLEVQDLVIRYGPFLAVDGLSINVCANEIVGVVGPNGGGKTSVVRAVGGLVRLSGGSVSFDGQNLRDVPAHERVRRGLAIVPEGRGLFPQMSVQENLQTAGDLLNDRSAVDVNIERCYAMFPILAQRRGQLAGTMSGGQQQMLAVSMGLMSSPRLLILDEPSLGLAPIIIGDIGRALKALGAEGLTVLLFEQNAKLTCGVADRIYLLAGGAIRHHDRAENLLASPELIEHLV